ncbi:hypothetical protein HY632_03210 [Candidatus Uhrbacteria bacterium]|nr:hypothetical protein [Candidatus Uhrbacteria bacterium]
MHLVISTQGKRKWISGIFQDEAQAVAHRERLPEPLRTHTVIQSDALTYPIAVIAYCTPAFHEHHFVAHAPEQAARELLRYALRTPQEQPHAPSAQVPDTLFCCTDDWESSSSNTGTDQMGFLPHIHLDPDHLSDIAAAATTAVLHLLQRVR